MSAIQKLQIQETLNKYVEQLYTILFPKMAAFAIYETKSA